MYMKCQQLGDNFKMEKPDVFTFLKLIIFQPKA